MLVGVPKEIKDSEYRVGLVPSTDLVSLPGRLGNSRDGVLDTQISSLSVSEQIPFVQPSTQKIFIFRFFRLPDLVSSFRCHAGRTRRHERGAECDGRKGAD